MRHMSGLRACGFLITPVSFAGWTCVACVANVAIAFTPHGGPVFNGGLGAHVWSIILQIVVVRATLLPTSGVYTVYAAPSPLLHPPAGLSS